MGYFVGTDGVYNSAANWSSTSGGAGGAGVPGPSDPAIFDANSPGACTVDVAINCAAFTVTTGYIYKLDFGDNSYTHTINGDALFEGTGEVDCGNATISIGGDFNNKDQGSWNRAGTHIIMTGPGGVITTSSANYFRDFTINEDTTISNNTIDYLRISDGVLTIASGKYLYEGNIPLRIWNGGFNSQGTVSVAAGSTALNLFLGANTITSMGTWEHGDDSYYATIEFWKSQTLPACSIGVNTRLNAQYGTGNIITLGGNVTFEKNVQFYATTGEEEIFDPANHDVTFQGDVIEYSTGTIGWVKGSGTITFSGTANQDINLMGLSVEDIEIDKPAGTVTLTGDVTTDSFTGTSGALDVDGHNLETIGDFTSAAGMSYTDTAGDGLVTVGGAFTLNGINGDEITWDWPDPVVTGTATASWTIVSNSDASAGTQINASDNCTDGGGNVGWNFSALSSVTSDLTSTWSILSVVVSDTETRWEILNAIDTDLQLAWDLLVQAVSDLPAAWNTLNAIISDLDSDWSILVDINSDVNFSWDMRQAVMSALESHYSILNAVGVSADMHWSIANAVITEMSAQWQILNSATSDSVLRWNTLEATDSSVTFQWSIDGDLLLAPITFIQVRPEIRDIPVTPEQRIIPVTTRRH